MNRPQQLRSYVLIGALAAVMLLLPRAGEAQSKVRIGLAVPNYPVYTPVYTANELGYFKENGLTVEITEYRGGPVAMEAAAAGAVDLFSAFPPTVGLAVKKGIKVKLVAANLPRPGGWHLMVLKDSPIRSLKDLAGKKVAITTKGGTTDHFALHAAAKAGVTIQTIPVGGGGLIPALKSRQVDAASLFDSLALRLLVSGEGRSLIDFGKEMEPTLPDSWAATQKFIDEQPQLLAASLKSIFKATAYMQRNRDYSLKYVKAFMKETDDQFVQAVYDVVIMALTTDGMIRPEWLESSMKLARFGGITDLPSNEEVFTGRFVPVKAD